MAPTQEATSYACILKHNTRPYFCSDIMWFCLNCAFCLWHVSRGFDYCGHTHVAHTWYAKSLLQTPTQLSTGCTPALKSCHAVQVLPKGYGGQAEMITLQDYVKMHILPEQQVSDMLCTISPAALPCVVQCRQS